MQSYLLLAVVACLLAVPGVAASFAAFPPGEASILTRAAAAFGLGYVVAGGIAFSLAAAGVFRLSWYISVWLAGSAALWALALRRASFREQMGALGRDIASSKLPLAVGAVILAAYVVVHLKFLHDLGASRYVYYLNGIEIANGGKVPTSTLEYGQWWPPATDKIFLDDFTGVLVMIGRNVAIGPGVLLLTSIVGAGLGLWATAWELGLRWTSVLAAVLALSNQVIFNTALFSGHGRVLPMHGSRVSTDFTEYHADDFGRAVAFCALALGIYAIRRRRWGLALPAGLVLAAASGTHLVPVVEVVIAICFAVVAEFLRAGDNRARLLVLRQAVVVAGVSGAGLVLIRFFASGSFGLGGASDPAAYAAASPGFDPTYFLFSGRFTPIQTSGHWYVSPGKVVADLTAGAGIIAPAWTLLALYAAMLAAAVWLFARARDDLRTIGVVGLGTLVGLIAVAMFFSFRYRVYVDGTFGARRLMDYSSLGVILLALGVAEALILYLGRGRPRAAAISAVAAVAVLSAWALPVSAASARQDRISRDRVVLVDWLRAHTPCNARILANQRSEGAFTALTGRYALLEGMGPFLRVNKLPYVVSLFQDARRFFNSPAADEAFLRQHDISYVVLARTAQLVGYGGPTGSTNYREMRAAPFLHPVLQRSFVTVYKVDGATDQAVSPLLKGPYLHCVTTPVRF